MIYKGSRYTNTPVVTLDGVKSFGMRQMCEFSYKNCKNHTVIEGDTLDGLSYYYYGTSQYWWMILDANPKYVLPTDIQIGDNLVIPHISEVISKL